MVRAARQGRARAPLRLVSTTMHDGMPTPFDPSRPANKQDKLLFTPGPLTTSLTTKQAAMRDLGSRDIEFMTLIREVCDGILAVAGLKADTHVTVPVQGSGTYGVEATVCSAVSKQSGALLLVANGAYGLRIRDICARHGIACTTLEYKDCEPPNLSDIEKALAADGGKHTHVAVVHSETTSGIINDIEGVGGLARAFGRSLIVDAMSSFGGLPIDFERANIDFLVTSSNKCVEGIPGFSLVIARKTALARCKGVSDSLVLDLHAQRAALDAGGQFRFTPPTHSMLAFRQALRELEQEGGVLGRERRYRANQQTLQAGMRELGFELYLPPHLAGPIITSYVYPKDKNWSFDTFYNRLNDRGFVIYPGKVTMAEGFRMGHIGRLFPADTTALLAAVKEVCKDMKILGHH